MTCWLENFRARTITTHEHTVLNSVGLNRKDHNFYILVPKILSKLGSRQFTPDNNPWKPGPKFWYREVGTRTMVPWNRRNRILSTKTENHLQYQYRPNFSFKSGLSMSAIQAGHKSVITCLSYSMHYCLVYLPESMRQKWKIMDKIWMRLKVESLSITQ